MSSSIRETQQRVRLLVEDLVQDEGFELVAVVLTTSHGRRTLRVHIDRPGGVSVGNCTTISRLLGPVLDVEDPVDGAYHLEVSSPGMDRPVQRREDFERFAGYRARLRLEPGAGPRKLTVTLRGVDGDDLLIERTEHVRRVPLEAVERAHLVLDIDEYRAISGLGPDNATGEL